jgi:hypothetical protein
MNDFMNQNQSPAYSHSSISHPGTPQYFNPQSPTTSHGKFSLIFKKMLSPFSHIYNISGGGGAVGGPTFDSDNNLFDVHMGTR